MSEKNVLSKILFMILALSLAIIVSSPSWATEYYVSTSGSDSSKGTSPSTPWKSLEHAESQATSPGDIVYLRRGDTWNYSANSNPCFAINGVHGSSSNYITWDGGTWGTGNKATIQLVADFSTDSSSIVAITDSSYLNFKNVVIQGNNHKTMVGLWIGGTSTQNDENHINVDGCEVYNIGNGSFYGYGIMVRTWNTPIHDITVQNCIVNRTDSAGILSYPAKTQILSGGRVPYHTWNLLFRNNHVINYGARRDEAAIGMGFYNWTTDSVMEYNYVDVGNVNFSTAAVWDGCNDSNGDYYPYNNTFRFNIVNSGTTRNPAYNFGENLGGGIGTGKYYIYGNVFISGDYTGGSSDYSSGIQLKGGYDVYIYNNTFITRNPGGYGCINEWMSGSGTFHSHNNIFYMTGTQAYTSGKPSTHGHNLYYRTDGGSLVGSYTASNITSWESSAVTGNPQFVNINDLPSEVDPSKGPSPKGLSLSAGSPAINTGDTLTSLGWDYVAASSINGVTRGSGSGWDIGAYEHSGSSGLSLLPPINLQIMNMN